MNADNTPQGRPLSPREIEVLQLMLRGMNAAEIGAELYIAVTTIRTHMHNVMEKLGVKSRDELVAYVKKHPDVVNPPAS
jgi:DNA-binding NarL/FixJ family response regulator